MISRSVLTDGKRNLDEILDSHPEDSTDPLFFAPEMAELAVDEAHHFGVKRRDGRSNCASLRCASA